ncbi:MAG: hypothetical protein JRI22_21875 [Deltaproteobacteria bacterium]|nr:hypothetical protein [Deltaproteobacteria bacterium]
MKACLLFLTVSLAFAGLILSPMVSVAQSIAVGSKKLACDRDHLALTTSVTNNREIALKVIVGMLLRGENEACLQGVRQEFELQPGESRHLTFVFDKVPCVEGKYRTDHKVLHDYVPRMVAQEKFEDLCSHPVLDGVPKKYQNLFKNFDDAAKKQLINAVRSGDLESRLKAELNSFMLECP